MIEKTAIDKMEGGGGVDGIKSNYDQITEFDESFAFKKQGKHFCRHKHTLYMRVSRKLSIQSKRKEVSVTLVTVTYYNVDTNTNTSSIFKRDKVKGESGGESGEGIGKSGRANNGKGVDNKGGNVIRPIMMRVVKG